MPRSAAALSWLPNMAGRVTLPRQVRWSSRLNDWNTKPISVLSARLEAGQISLEGAIDDLVARLSGQLDGPDTTGLRAELTELLHSLIATDPYLAQLAAQIEQARPVDAPRAGDRPRDAFDRRGNDP